MENKINTSLSGISPVKCCPLPLGNSVVTDDTNSQKPKSSHRPDPSCSEMRAAGPIDHFCRSLSVANSHDNKRTYFGNSRGISPIKQKHFFLCIWNRITSKYCNIKYPITCVQRVRACGVRAYGVCVCACVRAYVWRVCGVRMCVCGVRACVTSRPTYLIREEYQ